MLKALKAANVLQNKDVYICSAFFLLLKKWHNYSELYMELINDYRYKIEYESNYLIWISI